MLMINGNKMKYKIKGNLVDVFSEWAYLGFVMCQIYKRETGEDDVFGLLDHSVQTIKDLYNKREEEKNGADL